MTMSDTNLCAHFFFLKIIKKLRSYQEIYIKERVTVLSSDGLDYEDICSQLLLYIYFY